MDAVTDTTTDLEKAIASRGATEFICQAIDLATGEKCGKKCLSSDEGANAIMSYCCACNIILTADLSNVDPSSDDDTTPIAAHAGDVATAVPVSKPQGNQKQQQKQDVGEDDDVNSQEAVAAVLNTLDGVDAAAGTMSLSEIGDVFISLVQSMDARQTATIKLGWL